MTAVNTARLQADLKRRLGRELNCPLCNGSTLMFSDKAREMDLAVPMHKRSNDFSEAIVVATVSCMDCGHVMLFDTKLVDTW